MFSKLLPSVLLYAGRRTFSICSKIYTIPNSNGLINRPPLKLPNDYSQKRCFGTHIVIRHNRDSFYIDIAENRAELLFSVDAGVMTIKSTKVPKALGGHGIGKILAKAALEYALLNGYFIIIKCQFVQHYIDKYEPQYAEYILKKNI
ncbi:protein NATD1 [Drosophila eugracilis]|uniref:protein NATD1 n=1 Tax=Drosophila eugracilis TaxID=29029 RepID=UPI0007E7A8D2|nr:protein NATD1 [Drosophila eugracilis]